MTVLLCIIRVLSVFCAFFLIQIVKERMQKNKWPTWFWVLSIIVLYAIGCLLAEYLPGLAVVATVAYILYCWYYIKQFKK